MKLLIAYFKDKKWVILSFFLFAAIFAVSFFLFHLPIEAVLYPFGLCALTGAFILAADFYRVARKHERLAAIHKHNTVILSELPAAGCMDDRDYQAVILSLREEAMRLEAAMSAKYSDMMDYYTVWAHQIKTPIASMRLTLQNDDSPLSRTLMSDLFRIEQYVEMVLAFLRLDSDSSDYVFREYSVDDIVKKAVKKFSSEFIGRKITLAYQLCNCVIVTDEKWLSFVIEQIISNALKYTRQGSIQIALREPKVLCIRDTGIGIAKEDLPRIFERGYTGCNGRADAYSSGLGLYLCRRVCDNLGIAVSVASELGSGTEVALDLSQYCLKKE